jgi:antirestriction protein ArdC
MITSEFHRQVADKVIAAMQDSGTNWCKCWTPIGGCPPTSISTGNPYSGINILILGLTRMAKGWQSNQYGTFKSWRAKGYSVAKGEKATHIVWYGSGSRKVQNEDGTEDSVGWRAVRAYPVFNAEQVADYTPTDIGDVPEFTKQANTAMDKLASDVGVDVRNVDLARAFYAPSPDYVNMPHIDQFDSAEAYACTLGHEMSHWTGHKSRLDRAKGYAFEELVAEIGSAMLAASLGISPTPRADHAKYLNNWVQDINDKPSTIISAAAKAQAASNYLLEAQAAQVGLAA